MDDLKIAGELTRLAEGLTIGGSNRAANNNVMRKNGKVYVKTFQAVAIPETRDWKEVLRQVQGTERNLEGLLDKAVRYIEGKIDLVVHEVHGFSYDMQHIGIRVILNVELYGTDTSDAIFIESNIPSWLI